MDRYNEVKFLLKNWEQEFVKEHLNKPTKVSLRKAERQRINLSYTTYVIYLCILEI